MEGNGKTHAAREFETPGLSHDPNLNNLHVHFSSRLHQPTGEQKIHNTEDRH